MSIALEEITKVSERCRDCNACCTKFGDKTIPPDGMEPMKHCPHALMAPHKEGELAFSGIHESGVNGAPSNCKIYETRGDNCRKFLCLYAKGIGEEYYARPDVSGFIFNQVKSLPNVLNAFALWEDAHLDPAGIRALEGVSIMEKKIIMVRRAGMDDTVIEIIGNPLTESRGIENG